MIPTPSTTNEPCFWSTISSRVDESAKLLIIADNAKSHNVREAASLALGFTSTHSHGSSSCWSTPRLSRWETSSSGGTSASRHDSSGSESSSESSEEGDYPSSAPSTNTNGAGSAAAPTDTTTYGSNPLSVPLRQQSPVKAIPQDTRLRLPTRKISDPVPVRIPSMDMSAMPKMVFDTNTDHNTSPSDTTLRLPKRKPSDDPSSRMTTVMETKAMVDIVVQPPVEYTLYEEDNDDSQYDYDDEEQEANDNTLLAKAASTILIDVPKAPQRKASDATTISHSSSSTRSERSMGRPPKHTSNTSLSEPTKAWVEKLSKHKSSPKAMTGPRLPVRKGSLDPEEDSSFAGDDEEGSLSSASSSKKKNFDQMIDDMLDQFERDPKALIQQALATCGSSNQKS